MGPVGYLYATALTEVYYSDLGYLKQVLALLPDQVALKARPSDIHTFGVGLLYLGDTTI